MKKLYHLLMLLPVLTQAQVKPAIRLTDAYEQARKNYPSVKQKDLISKTAGLNIDVLQKGFLPQFSLSGQASYQSEVTAINIPIPGIKINPPSKDQYKVLADVNQLLYDGGSIREQKNIQKLNELNEQQKLEVELYGLKDRINQLFMGILFLDEQIRQTDLLKDDINTGILKTEALLANGVTFRSSVDVLKAELLKTDQRVIELRSARKGLVNVLAMFLGQPLSENVQLEKPLMNTASLSNEIRRPELTLYSTQEKLLQGQTKLIDSRNRPKTSLFFQGGYGRPGLNFLNNDFSLFYTTGLRLNWAFGGLYTMKKEKQLIDLNRKAVDIQQQTFLFNTNAALLQQQSEIEKQEQLIEKDNAIIDLRIKVKEAAKAQLENGVITTNDYLREVNAEDQARQALIIHRVQLLQAQVNYMTITGKL